VLNTPHLFLINEKPTTLLLIMISDALHKRQIPSFLKTKTIYLWDCVHQLVALNSL